VLAQHIRIGFRVMGWVRNIMNSDRTAKIWDVATGKVKKTLEGHTHAVAVNIFDDGTIITGAQDKMIRLWTKDGVMIKEFQAHEDIVRDFSLIPGIGFASCSNDE
jgi:WD40 repeat protein